MNTDVMCWRCRRKFGVELRPGPPFGWEKCSVCKKTREQREPPPKQKLQPPTKRFKEKRSEERVEAKRARVFGQ